MVPRGALLLKSHELHAFKTRLRQHGCTECPCFCHVSAPVISFRAGSLDPAGAPPAALAADLGMHMLLELFRGQREFRRDVVALCHNHLIGAKVRSSPAQRGAAAFS